ncbi:MAG: hypothetical protein GY940_20585, partial [bacterium]|nr:hypothetical protein [bacterium]
MNTSNERLIHEFGDLLNIPGFREAVIHKIEELKALMGKDIEHYHVIKDVIRPDPVKSPAEGNRFRLDRVESSLWIPSLVPDGEGETGEIESLRIYSIIPQELIQFVVKKQAPPGIIVPE